MVGLHNRLPPHLDPPVHRLSRMRRRRRGQATDWLAVNVCEAERRPELVRDELLVRCRAERIEPRPPAGSTESCGRRCIRPSGR